MDTAQQNNQSIENSIMPSVAATNILHLLLAMNVTPGMFFCAAWEYYCQENLAKLATNALAGTISQKLSFSTNSHIQGACERLERWQK